MNRQGMNLPRPYVPLAWVGCDGIDDVLLKKLHACPTFKEREKKLAIARQNCSGAEPSNFASERARRTSNHATSFLGIQEKLIEMHLGGTRLGYPLAPRMISSLIAVVHNVAKQIDCS